ncbi:hypothetical protein [Massilia horti]|uniref:Uncharacterized protein n=1 Tax=Massilia horti TaxID=2562153 RepID=A0A4Y9T3X0_9BURK|nr:hypothetical protein [Massilia horti]TFW32240.1 hypothetical protein E4O92_10505 [Massilia horti]
MTFTNSHRGLRAALAALALAAAAPAALAEIDCWMDAEHPQTADQLAVGDARVAPLRQTLHQINALLHRQSALHELPRTRLRSSWQIGGLWNMPSRGANFLLRDHREPMWRGTCDVIKGADRWEPRATIVVTVNSPNTFFATAVPEFRDEQLEAYRELPATGRLGGHTLYGGHMLVFTPGGRLPWVPVSTAEYLDFMERSLQRQAVEADANRQAARQAAAPEAQEAMMQRVAEGLRKVDPAKAEQMMAEIRAQQAGARAHAEAVEARRRANPAIDNDPTRTMLAKLRAWRAALSPAQLAQQARLGLDGLQPQNGPAENYPLLAKPDPAFPWDRQHPARAQMLMVSVRGGDTFEMPMQRVLQTLDLAGLQALVATPNGGRGEVAVR